MNENDVSVNDALAAESSAEPAENVENTAAESENASVELETESIVRTPEQINAANAAASTGNVSDDGQGAAFFSSADVRAMSREQVRRNLDKILKSMESPEF